MISQIIAETNQWIAINKPGSLNVEQLWDYDSVEQQVKNYLEKKGARKPYVGIVHRLDRPVSGALIVAKKKSTLKLLNHQFSTRQVKKKYLAIVSNEPPPGKQILSHYIIKDQKNKRANTVPDDHPQGVAAKLSYQLIATAQEHYLLEVIPTSGKFHQIRVQLGAAGYPILGDEKYGSAHTYFTDQIALHAQSLFFSNTPELKLPLLEALTPKDEVWQKFKL